MPSFMGVNLPGKYEAFRKKYPKAPIEGDRFAMMQTVLDAFAFPAKEGEDQLDVTRVRDLDNTRLRTVLIEIRRALSPLEAQIETLKIREAAVVFAFTERFDEDEITSMKFADGVGLNSNCEPLPSVNDKTTLYKWIKETGQEDLLTLNYQTLASIVKTAILEGKALPPGVDVFIKQKLSVTGMKNLTKEKHDTSTDQS